MTCPLIGTGVDADNRGRTPPPDANAKRWRKGGARAMTPKERLQVHAEIERENARKLREWKQMVETRLTNLRLAAEEMRKLEKEGALG